MIHTQQHSNATRNYFITLYLAGLLLIIFALQNIFGWDLAWTVGSVDWRFFVSMLAHGSIAHILGNLFALVVFGLILEELLGSKRYVLVLFFAGVVGNLAGIGQYTKVLGISGAIYGIFGALAILRPKMVVWASGMPMPMLLAAIGWTIGDILGAFANTSTGHLAHLAGAGVGIILGIYWRKSIPKEPRLRNKTFLSKSQKQQLDAALDNWEDTYMK